ncbi:hypothetical protein V6N13_090990 [Hibiscus sabdariffa]
MATIAEELVLEFYMHDILGGSNHTAQPITGLLRNIYSGQVTFAKPVGFLPPPTGWSCNPQCQWCYSTVNCISGLPFGTSLDGSTFVGNPNQNGNPQIPLGPDGLGLGFGTIIVIDDILTISFELGSEAIGVGILVK